MVADKPRSIEELRDNAEHMTKLERAVWALDQVAQPARAGTVAKAAGAYEGLCSTSISKLLPRHPQVEREKEGRLYVYRISEGS